ncbi:hypothetical protein F5Y19DRAFT_480480 [Xylariaceae sp. FL1651]|nr:hypothetical protein F5Y19DRAFT_480480 [Xylariaceae sp. FL1651]
MDTWEDLHPGDRLPISTESFTGLHIYPQVLGGTEDTTGSVAAKARGASLAKRNIRLRQRIGPKPLRIPTQVLEDPNVKRDAVLSPHPINMTASTTMSPVHFLPMPETLRPLEIDATADTDITVGTEKSTRHEKSWAALTKTTSYCFTDLSNYIGCSLSRDDNGNAMTSISSKVLTRASSCETDSYGWENEYDHKIDCGNTNLICNCSKLLCKDRRDKRRLHVFPPLR